MCDFQIDHWFFNSKSSTIKTKKKYAKWNATLMDSQKYFNDIKSYNLSLLIRK